MNSAYVWLSQFWTPRREWYRSKYLWSNHWRRFRAVYGWLVGWRCHRCGTVSRHNDVHHKRYDVLWFEWLHPLSVEMLCRRCHDREHG